MNKNPVKPYEVELSSSAEAVYLTLKGNSERAESRGDVSNSHITTFRMIKDAIRIIEASPCDRKHALAGKLSSIYRVKKGRMRICWVASTKLRKLCILFISETLRKDGDAHDPYAIFTQMVLSGQFSNVFQELGVEIPDDHGIGYRIQ